MHVFAPKGFLVHGRHVVVGAFHDSHTRAVGGCGRRLHRARTLRLQLLWILVHEPVEEVRERVEREVGICIELLAGQQQLRVQLHGWVVM